MKLKHDNFRGIGIGLIFLLLVQLVLPTTIGMAENNNKNATIGGVAITVKKESDIQSVLAKAIAEWKNHPILIKGQSGSMEIPTEMIHFNIKETVKTYLKESKAPWYKPWKKREVIHLPLSIEVSDDIDPLLRENPFFQIKETRAAIANHARYLQTNHVEPVEKDITKDLMDRKAFEIQQIPKSRTSLSALVAMLDGMVLSQNETFSFLERTKEITGAIDIEARRFFSSVLYSVVLQAETTILERHSQNKIPNYLQPGIEVDVSQRLQKDFAFQNNGNSPMLFNAKIENNNLLIELYTLKNAKKVTYSVIETKVEPKTIYRLSSKLKNNQSKVVEQGKVGYRVTVYRTLQDESYDADEEVSRDFYAPVHKVIEVSSREEITNDSNSEDSDSSDSDDSSSPNDSGSQGKNSNENKDNNNNPENVENDAQEEIIYDKGGNVIYDPNA